VRKIFDESHANKLKARITKCPEIKNDLAALGAHYGINSRGGDVAAAMAIGRILRRERAHLMVDDYCISSCVLILAGAVDRYIGRSAVVGIHRPYLAGTTAQRLMTTEQVEQVKSVYGNILQDIRAYLREMNISERLADDMLTIEPERSRTLNQAELKGYGLATSDPTEQQRRAVENEVRNLQEAAQLGLDRAEYTRRKALGERICVNTAGGEPMTDYSEIWRCKQQVLKSGKR